MPSIRIHSHSFIISDPYTSGKLQVGPCELAALDRLRAENIRNNAAKQMDKMDWPLEADELDQFAKLIHKMDLEYRFPDPDKPHHQTGQFNRLVMEIAQDSAHQHLIKSGKLFPSQDEIEALAEKLVSDVEVQSEARRRLLVHSKLATEVIEDLIK